MKKWHIVISGFMQSAGKPNGMVALWQKLHAEHAAPGTSVILRSWNDNFWDLAELIWRLRGPHNGTNVKVYGYSWGGMSAVILARLLGDRGIKIKEMVLSDPVYRHRYWLGQWRAFAPWSKIYIPPNVLNVTWLRQVKNLPRSHCLVADNPSETHISMPRTLSRTHQYMDDAGVFHAAALAASRLL